jgi:hypothetical protein
LCEIACDFVSLECPSRKDLSSVFQSRCLDLASAKSSVMFVHPSYAPGMPISVSDSSIPKRKGNVSVREMGQGSERVEKKFTTTAPPLWMQFPELNTPVLCASVLKTLEPPSAPGH